MRCPAAHATTTVFDEMARRNGAMKRRQQRGTTVQRSTTTDPSTTSPVFGPLRRHWRLLFMIVAATLPAIAFGQDAAAAAPPPAPNKGDTAWMLTSTALVLLMSVPALALFYGGLVRSKNMLSMLMQVFVTFSLITVIWCIYGYSLAFTEGNAFFGGFDRLFLNGVFEPAKSEFALGATFSKATPMYEIVFVAFQATFAAITCCLILGAVAERMKFSAVLIFMVLWFTFSYAPIAHMVWFWMGPDAYTTVEAAKKANDAAGLI